MSRRGRAAVGAAAATGLGAPAFGASGAARPTLLPVSQLARDLPRGAKGEPKGSSAPVDDGQSLTDTVREIVEVVPPELMLALALLGVLTLVGLAGWLVAGLRSRRLSRRAGELEDEVGVLQGALLPVVRSQVNGLRASVAYRPAAGPGAGGDFYDVFAVGEGRVGLILGDASGHGREALTQTVFIRHTLRAYVEAGLEPRLALALAGDVIDDQLAGEFATVLVAVHDSERGKLTIASAGHPAPIVTGAGSFEPVTAASSPPIGFGYATGRRQTTISLPDGSLACFYTDGLTEARAGDGLFGRGRLERLCERLGPEADASTVVTAVAAEADEVPDDLAACIVAPDGRGDPAWVRIEELALDADDLGPIPAPSSNGGRRARSRAASFLAACDVGTAAAEQTLRKAASVVARDGAAVLRVELGDSGPDPVVVPQSVSPLADQHSPSAA